MLTTLSLILAVGVSCVVIPVPKDRDRTDKQAKEAAEQFVRALKAEDAKEAAKLSDLPYFWDGEGVIRDRGELEAAFARVFEGKDLTRCEFQVKGVHPAAMLPVLVPNRLREVARKVSKEIDGIVVVEVKRSDRLLVLIRIRFGKTKVVGFFD